MTGNAVQHVLARMARMTGMRSCAVVDLDTGMVWHAAGEAGDVALSEAASDYWRLCRRQTAFAALGATRAQVAIHDRSRLTIIPCGLGLLLVSISEEPDAVQWPAWRLEVGHLRRALDPG
jgi:hypothetical protein